MPIGSAKTSTNGTSKPTACATRPTVAWPLTSSARISFITLPSNSTSVKTLTAITSVASTCRVR